MDGSVPKPHGARVLVLSYSHARSFHEHSSELLRRVGGHRICTHFPKNRDFEICQRTKITRARAENVGDLIQADHKVQQKQVLHQNQVRSQDGKCQNRSCTRIHQPEITRWWRSATDTERYTNLQDSCGQSNVSHLSSTRSPTQRGYPFTTNEKPDDYSNAKAQ